MSSEPEAADLVVDRALVLRATAGLGLVLALAAACGVLLREPLTAVGGWFLGQYGWAGVFFGVVFTDASPLPLTHEPILLLAIASGLESWKIGLVASMASVAAGPVGWCGGRLLHRGSGARAWLNRRHPGMVAFLQRWGATGVAVAAVLPIPFSAATWTAGLTGVPFPKLVLASLFRVPKTWFYLWLLTAGWSVGG